MSSDVFMHITSLAKAGRMRDQVGWQHMRPTYRAVNDTSYHTAMFTVQSLLAATGR